MAEEVGYLPGREGADGSIRLFDSVDQISGEGMAEGILLQNLRTFTANYTACAVLHILRMNLP